MVEGYGVDVGVDDDDMSMDVWDAFVLVVWDRDGYFLYKVVARFGGDLGDGMIHNEERSIK